MPPEMSQLAMVMFLLHMSEQQLAHNSPHSVPRRTWYWHHDTGLAVLWVPPGAHLQLYIHHISISCPVTSCIMFYSTCHCTSALLLLQSNTGFIQNQCKTCPAQIQCQFEADAEFLFSSSLSNCIYWNNQNLLLLILSTKSTAVATSREAAVSHCQAVALSVGSLKCIQLLLFRVNPWAASRYQALVMMPACKPFPVLFRNRKCIQPHSVACWQ